MKSLYGDSVNNPNANTRRRNRVQEEVVENEQPTFDNNVVEENIVDVPNDTNNIEEEENQVSDDFAAAQELQRQQTASPDASSATQNPGKQKVGFKQWAILKKTIGLTLAAVAIAAIAVTGICSAVNKGNEAEVNANTAKENAYSQVVAVDELVNSTQGSISNAGTTVNTASNLVNQLEGEEVADQETAQVLASISQSVKEETATSLSGILTEAQTALTNAQNEYKTMQSSHLQLKTEYDNSNWAKVNELSSSIKANSTSIAGYTQTATNKANEVIDSINQLLKQAEESIQEAQESLEKTQQSAEKLYGQLPSFVETVDEAVSLIDSSINTIQSYIDKGSDDATKTVLDALKQSATTDKTNAQNEKTTFDALVEQIESAYIAGNYNDVIDLIKLASDSAKAIGSYATSASDSALTAADAYASYQETENDKLSQTIIQVMFTEEDLNNYQGITKYLINPQLGGNVNSVEKCSYNKSNGEVSILINCTGKDGSQYRNLITGTIASGLNDITPSTLINRLKETKVQSQAFDLEMETSSSGSITEANGTISGNADIQYSVDTVYNGKTGKTTINAKAIVVVKDNEGNISFKVYKLDPAVRNGNIAESDVQAEFEGKLLSLIEADNTITIESESSPVTINYEY